MIYFIHLINAHNIEHVRLPWIYKAVCYGFYVCLEIILEEKAVFVRIKRSVQCPQNRYH